MILLITLSVVHNLHVVMRVLDSMAFPRLVRNRAGKKRSFGKILGRPYNYCSSLALCDVLLDSCLEEQMGSSHAG